MAFRDWRWPQWLIIVATILIIAIGGLMLLLLRKQTPTVLPPTEQTDIPVTGLPSALEGGPKLPSSPIEQIPLNEVVGLERQSPVSTIATGGLTQVTNVYDYQAEYPSLASSGKDVNFYDPNSKRFTRINAEGSITKVGNKIFAEIENVTFADNSSDSIIEFPDGSNVLYNFDNETQVTLPKHWDDFDFSPDSKQIAFKSIALDPSQRFLAISDKTGNSTQKIAPLGEHADVLDVEWSPNNQVIGTYSETDGLDQSNLFFLGFNDENFPLTPVHGLKPEGTWTKDGEKFMYSSLHSDTDFKPRLWLVNGSGSTIGQNRQSIPLQTWTTKCTFTSDIAYCGVPRSLPDGAGLIPSIADEIPDDIYKVDLNSGAVSKIAIPQTSINVKNMIISQDGSQLFIQDRLSGTLKKIRLK